MKKFIIFCLFISLMISGCSLGPSKSYNDSNNIIGNPIILGNLEIAQYDFPEEMNWGDAKKACESLGDGWRLPTKGELNTLYEDRDKIGGFSLSSEYWSSTQLNFFTGAWIQEFNNGLQFNVDKSDTFYVRAVRTI
jgi:hypothetical protein